MEQNVPFTRVRHLDKTYRTQRGESVRALVDVSFDLADGEFVSCVGPSGCGKTTALKILGGVATKTAGEILVRGRAVEGPRRDIGMVFQTGALLPWRTVLENTLLPIEVQGRKKRMYVGRARELIQMAGLSGFEDRYPYELSGGMQQRNSIIRALIHDPSLLLMDEPFGALDAMTREQMNLELLRIWNQDRKTVFFITHSITEAVFLSDRVLVFSPRPGRIVDVVPVSLPRPRALDVMTSPEFGTYIARIRQSLNSASRLE